eukprot:Rhum_TRINITY_DN9732_c0_g1::Rhum_TRINITY_DN9732_c0_g1_i1::g.34703::m.34703
MSGKAKDKAAVEALDLYDAVLKEQDVLNAALRSGLVELARARVVLDMRDAADLSVDDLPEDVEASLRVRAAAAAGAEGKKKKKDASGGGGGGGSGGCELAVLQQAKGTPDPASYFARATDVVTPPQKLFRDALDSAVKLACLRQDLVESAESCAALRRQS